MRSHHVSLEVGRTRRQIFPTFLPMADTNFHGDDRPEEEEDGEGEDEDKADDASEKSSSDGTEKFEIVN